MLHPKHCFANDYNYYYCRRRNSLNICPQELNICSVVFYLPPSMSQRVKASTIDTIIRALIESRSSCSNHTMKRYHHRIRAAAPVQFHISALISTSRKWRRWKLYALPTTGYLIIKVPLETDQSIYSYVHRRLPVISTQCNEIRLKVTVGCVRPKVNGPHRLVRRSRW